MWTLEAPDTEPWGRTFRSPGYPEVALQTVEMKFHLTSWCSPQMWNLQIPLRNLTQSRMRNRPGIIAARGRKPKSPENKWKAFSEALKQLEEQIHRVELNLERR